MYVCNICFDLYVYSCACMYNVYGACVFINYCNHHVCGHVVRVCTYLRSIVWWCMNNVCVLVHNYVYMIEFTSVYMLLFDIMGVRIMFVCSCVYEQGVCVFSYYICTQVRSCDWLAGHVSGACV